jgi:hypothetical protein
MTPAQRQFVVLEQCLGAAIVNFILNAGIAWLMFGHAREVPLWGQQSIAGDTIGTCVVLPLLTCLIVTRIAQGRIRAGAFAPLGWTVGTHPLLDWVPRRTLWRGLGFAAITVLTLAPLTLFALHSLDLQAMKPGTFILFKAGFAVAVGLVVSPLVAVVAIAEAPVPTTPAGTGKPHA